ncbi:hypothetical protein CSPX01_00596 [Colletotrichum filicis]|nr:hypothetical protein CSPX01_00596 [Colletotrichum filicis]
MAAESLIFVFVFVVEWATSVV